MTAEDNWPGCTSRSCIHRPSAPMSLSMLRTTRSEYPCSDKLVRKPEAARNSSCVHDYSIRPVASGAATTVDDLDTARSVVVERGHRPAPADPLGDHGRPLRQQRPDLRLDRVHVRHDLLREAASRHFRRSELGDTHRENGHPA